MTRIITPHTLLSGVATVGEIALKSVYDSLVFGTEYLIDEPNEGFGNLEDIASPSGRSICINGTDCLTKPEYGYRNAVFLGGTGSGKSTIIAVPNLLKVNNASIICHDPSGELVNRTGKSLSERGYQVHVLDFNNPNNSIGLNPLDFIKKDNDSNKLAAHLVRNSLGTSKDKFWELASTDLLALFIKVILRQDKSYRNLTNVLHLLNTFSGDPQAIDRFIAKVADPKEFRDYKALIRSNEKTLQSIVMSCKAALSLWNDDDMGKVTSTSSIDFNEFRKGKHALFIKNTTMDAEYYHSIISFLIESALKVLMQRLPAKNDRPVWVIVDEASTLNLQSLDNIISNNRKYQISLMLFFQNKAQVYYAYGQEAGSNILANCFTKVYLAGTDMKTAKELEELLGWKNIINDEKEVKQPLMTAQQIRTLKSNQALAIIGNYRPIKMQMTPYYENPILRKLASNKPFIYTPPSPLTNPPLIPFT